MSYVDFYAFFEQPEKRWEIILSNRSPEPPEPDLFGQGGLEFRNEEPLVERQQVTSDFLPISKFNGQQ